jgi:RNA polymerase sigma-70 factor (ECF subfamily)
VDDALRERLAAGDTGGACQLLHDAFAGDVKRFVASRSRERPDRVDDVCQEVWAAVGRTVARFRFEATPRGWLLSIARRKLVDAWRDDAPVVALEDSLVDDPAISRPSARSELVREERRAALRAALATLAPGDRELLELRYLVGLKPAEIAETCGLDANTVSQRLLRATRRLRDALPAALFAP